MPLVIWNEGRSVGDDRMDEEHIGIISLVNHVYDALEANADARSIYRLLDALATATARHFLDEEMMLRRLEYAGLAAHSDEHDNLLRQIETVRDEVARLAERGLPPETGNLNRIWLLAWVMEHLEGADKEYMKAITGTACPAA